MSDAYTRTRDCGFRILDLQLRDRQVTVEAVHQKVLSDLNYSIIASGKNDYFRRDTTRTSSKPLCLFEHPLESVTCQIRQLLPGFRVLESEGHWCRGCKNFRQEGEEQLFLLSH